MSEIQARTNVNLHIKLQHEIEQFSWSSFLSRFTSVPVRTWIPGWFPVPMTSHTEKVSFRIKTADVYTSTLWKIAAMVTTSNHENTASTKSGSKASAGLGIQLKVCWRKMVEKNELSSNLWDPVCQKDGWGRWNVWGEFSKTAVWAALNKHAKEVKRLKWFIVPTSISQFSRGEKSRREQEVKRGSEIWHLNAL